MYSCHTFLPGPGKCLVFRFISIILYYLKKDSQETIPETESLAGGSQDLFLNPPASVRNDRTDEIIRKLDKLTGDVALLRREVAELRGKSPASAKAFNINTASCKRRFNLYLRSRFSCRPWLEVKSDDFKNEVHTCLAMDDMRTNPAAFQGMVSHSLHKFTELRNQFRRKILADKQSIPCKGLGELCYDIFHSYSKADECTLSQDRMHATILLRHFLHKKRYFNDGTSASFWAEFRSFWEEIEKDGRPQKWERLEEIDKRRTERARENSGNTEE